MIKCPARYLYENVACHRFIHRCKKHRIHQKTLNKWRAEAPQSDV